MNRYVDKSWFADRIGLSIDEVSSVIDDEELKGLEYEALPDLLNTKQLEHMEKVVVTQDFRVSTQESNSVWEDGWEEIYNRLGDSVNIVESILKPQYFDKGRFVRFDGKYIKTLSEGFEYRMDLLIRKLVFYKYFTDIEDIVELGCGTGNSLLLLNKLFPTKSLLGADWATSSQKLIEKIALATGARIQGLHFNMFTLEGKKQLPLLREHGVLTVHSLEQLGRDFKPLLTYIIESKAKVCVHLEPINEFYDPDSRFDNVALTYHNKRNYLFGFYQQLTELEEEGIINIIDAKRIGFGGLYHEAYNLIVWQPK